MRPSAAVVWLVPFLLVVVPCRADEFRRHVAVSQERHASEAGRDVMRAGGNAVDAAIATAFALAVTHPAAGNIGGGGFIVAYLADRHDVLTIDFREAAPLAATERMYVDTQGALLPGHRTGPRAAGVPGTVRGLGLAHERWGTQPWATLVAPAVKLARDGFPISDTLARSLNAQLFRNADPTDVPEDLGPRAHRLGDFPASVKAFQKADGTPWKAGDRLVQPDLAATLERIALVGPDEFYRGETAQMIAADSQSNGGLITLEDLARYQAKVRAPVHGTYRGKDIYGMGPTASGGIVTLLALNILERFDLRASGPGSTETLHRVAEASKRAFFVRATAIADPDFVPVPVEKLVSKAYANELAATMTDQATPSAKLAPFPIERPEGNDTTHLSTLDGSGNAVALTYTLEEGYGAKSVVPGAGFLLNNEMGDFNLMPGKTTTRGTIGTPANLIAPGKRMLSSQAPTIVLEAGKVRVVTGSPGGRTIPSTVLWVLLHTLEFQLAPRAAVDAPRAHHPWFPDALVLEGTSWEETTKQALRDRGHVVRGVSIQGDANTIIVDPATGLIHGLADRRRKTETASGD